MLLKIKHLALLNFVFLLWNKTMKLMQKRIKIIFEKKIIWHKNKIYLKSKMQGFTYLLLTME